MAVLLRGKFTWYKSEKPDQAPGNTFFCVMDRNVHTVFFSSGRSSSSIQSKGLVKAILQGVSHKTIPASDTKKIAVCILQIRVAKKYRGRVEILTEKKLRS